jgi:hypothetical protein
VETAFQISQANNYYPLLLSHALLRSLCLPDKQKETKTTPDWIIKAIRLTGGMIGLRTSSIPLQTYAKSGVPNDCDGSSKTFAQAYQYGVLGVNVSVTFGSDLNGFIQQIRPRFGNSEETCGASGDDTTRAKQQGLQMNNTKLGTIFDHAGFGHIGLLPDVVRELRDILHVNTYPLEYAAETFVQLWERMYDANRRGPLSLQGFHPLDPSSTSPNGVVHA